jgi:hypothetical protein
MSFFYVFAYNHLMTPLSDMNGYLIDGVMMNLYIKHDCYQYASLLIQQGGEHIPPHLREPIFAMNYWGNTGNYLMVRIYAFFILLSKPNLYVISIFFAMISYIGKWSILQYFSKYTNSKTQDYIFIAILFFLPNESFWTSGLHKEALIILSLGMVMYGMRFFSYRNVLIQLLGLYIMFLIRDFYFFVLFITLIVYYLMHYTNVRMRHIIGISASFVILFLLSPLKLEKNLFKIILQKKAEFAVLKNAQSQLDVLHFTQAPIHTIYSVFKNSIIEPTIFHARNLMDWVICMENIMMLFLMCYISFHIRKRIVLDHLYLFIFSITILLFIGYTIPNYGTILRYRSVPYILMIAGIYLCYILSTREKNNT